MTLVNVPPVPEIYPTDMGIPNAKAGSANNETRRI